MKNALKSILYELLNDTEVQEEIRKIVQKDRSLEGNANEKIKELEKEIKRLYGQLEETQKECEKRNNDYKKLEAEKAVLEKENQNIQDSMNNIHKEFENYMKEFEPFEEIKEVWQGFLKLEKSQQLFLKNLCGSWDIKSFIALGKDKNGIRQLWDFIRDEIMNSDRNRENISILARYFDLCIDVYNKTNIRKEYYNKTEVLIGTEYDSRQHIKTAESVVNGVVQEIVLNGYDMQEDVIKPIVVVK